jgi:hypothetical protein
MRFLAAVLVLLAACDNNDTPNAANAERSTDAGPRDFGAIDAELTGHIYAFDRAYTSDAGPSNSYSVTAGFAEEPSEICADITPLLSGDECKLRECYPRTPPSLDGGARVTAGDIVIDGGSHQVYLFAQFGGQYSPWNYSSSYFSGGELLHAEAVGAEIPAFQIEVTAPSQPILSTPIIPPAGEKLELNRNDALELRWSNSTLGLLRFTLSGFEVDRRRAVECKYAASAGQGTVPKAILAGLPAGEAVYELRVESTAETNAGDFLVRFTAAANVVGTTNLWARGDAVLR